MQIINITVHTESISQIDAIKSLMKSLNIKFEISKEEPYDEEFVDMVAEAEDEIIKGRGLKMTSEAFDKLWK
jgi:hypothetical protein